MVQIALIALVIFILCGVLHYVCLISAMRKLKGRSFGGAIRMSVTLLVCGLAHISEAGVYALGYMLGEALGFGSFLGQANMTSMDVFYFSLVSYTSLGLGDIYPVGHLRFLAGIEALNGFLLISCSAALIFHSMSDHLRTECLKNDGIDRASIK